jgi:hypothetical protein
MGIKLEYRAIISLICISVFVGVCSLFGIQEDEQDIEVDCNELAAVFIDQDPDSFESLETGIAWCEECLSRGGVPKYGLFQGPTCANKTVDEGESCTDSDQCQGFCIAKKMNSRKGKCTSTDAVFGCVFEMYDGEVIETCYD